MTKEPVAGKFLLEILTKGMYSNPLHIYREYIQNCVDSIDKAIEMHVMKPEEAEIHITIDKDNNKITIRDNGLGISSDVSQIILMNIGASEKDGITERGFRGIGRLGGLAYAKTVIFLTKSKNDEIETKMICDCEKMNELLKRSNNETSDIMETFKNISHFEQNKVKKDDHYFEVQLIDVPYDSILLHENSVLQYLSETAPVDFDFQKFPQAREIHKFFDANNAHISCYKILRGTRKLQIFKNYSRDLKTGIQKKSIDKDYVRNIEFLKKEASDGKTLFIAWLAITDFSGIINDESVQGIRFRKGNILVGNNKTFEKFFPSEGQNANRMFAGEIHVLHEGIIPNSQRDDFEPGPLYDELKLFLSDWAGTINKKYRRGTSEASSAIRKLKEALEEQNELNDKLNSGAITSDEKREQLASDLDKIDKKREKAVKEIKRAVEKGVVDEARQITIENLLSKSEKSSQLIPKIRQTIINSEYATKNDLPSSYTRGERKLYQKIISVIDSYFFNDPKTAEELREKIKNELSEKKK